MMKYKNVMFIASVGYNYFAYMQMSEAEAAYLAPLFAWIVEIFGS